MIHTFEPSQVQALPRLPQDHHQKPWFRNCHSIHCPCSLLGCKEILYNDMHKISRIVWYFMLKQYFSKANYTRHDLSANKTTEFQIGKR